MKKDFNNAVPPLPRQTVNSVNVDAIRFIMDNVFDWDSQQKHAGLRMGYDDCKVLVKSLRSNLHATCPDVHDEEITDLYGELLHNNWAGEYQDIKDLTEKVVLSYLEAEMNNFEPISDLKRLLKGKINFMEAHYSDVRHTEELPMHVAADAMEKNDKSDERQSVEGLSSTLNQIRTVVDNGNAADNSLARRKFPGLFRLIGR